MRFSSIRKFLYTTRMTDTNQTLQAVKRFSQLAGDTNAHGILIKTPEIMTNLVRYMNSNSLDIVSSASDCLKKLAKNKANRKTLYYQPGLMKALTELTGSEHSTVKKNALSALKSLNKYAKKQNDDDDVENMSGSTMNTRRTTSQDKPTKEKRKARTFVLSADLNDEDLCSRIEKHLLKVPGLISLTLDQRRNQILVTTKRKKKEVKSELLDAVKHAGGNVTSVGQIGKKSKRVHTRVDDETLEDAEDAAGYLDEEEVYGNEPGVLSKFGSTTLQARLAEQRRKDAELANQKSSTAVVAAAAGNAVRGAMSWFGY